MLSNLMLCTLGYPELRSGNQIIKFRTRKCLALLVYLLVESRETAQSRETIAALLWSDSPDGRENLRNTKRYINETLKSYSLELANIITSNKHYVLKISPRKAITSDIQLIEELLQQSSQTRILPLDLAQQALALCQGEFLAGFVIDNAEGFEEWVSAQRSRYNSRMQLLCSQLAKRYMAQGNLQQALELTNRSIELDKFDEEAYRRKMQLQWSQNERIGALQTYENYRATLWQEFAAEPDEDLQDLAQLIRQSSSSHSKDKKEFLALPLDSPQVLSTLESYQAQYQQAQALAPKGVKEQYFHDSNYSSAATGISGRGHSSSVKNSREGHSTRYNKKQLRQISIIMMLANSGGACTLALLSILNDQILLWGSFAIALIVLIIYLVGYRLNQLNHYRLASWLIIGSTFTMLTLDYWLLGVDGPLTTVFIVVIALSIALMSTFEALLLTGATVVVCGSLFVSHHFLHIYEPPIILPAWTTDVMNAACIFIVLPTVATIGLLSIKRYTNSIRRENEEIRKENKELREFIRITKQNNKLSGGINKVLSLSLHLFTIGRKE